MNLLYSELDSARYIDEDRPASASRSEFRRDFGRVLHCPSFRRLQGKTQLFPGYESDFFRNRLTHSLEVAQIAESIATRLNHDHEFFQQNKIATRVCFTAALLHDIGHPPFGHNGEEALDERMHEFGGFEGNAQSLRIVTQLEKKRRNAEVLCPLESRAGLNLTYRVLASILKYDSVIPSKRSKGAKVCKGYYLEDKPVVDDIKKHVAPGWKPKKRKFQRKLDKLKSLECSIMDIADDIAYSTYDLEDSFKAGFLSPTKILLSDEELLERVAKQVEKDIGEPFTGADVVQVFFSIFSRWVSDSTYKQLVDTPDDKFNVIINALALLGEMDSIASESELRTAFTSDLVGHFVEAVGVEVNDQFPQLSRAVIDPDVRKEIETIKRYTYEAVIASNRVRLSEYRGKEVVGEIFDALMEKRGAHLLPDDIRKLHEAANGNRQRESRVICDFVAGMTDRYALEFHGRLHSDSPQTIFKDA